MIVLCKRTSLLMLGLAILAMTSACASADPSPVEDSDAQPALQDVPATANLDARELDEGALQAPADFTPSKDRCPGLDSVLVQLVEADQPAKFAAQQQLTLEGDTVQVVIQLASADASVLKQFNVEPDSQNGTVVQTYVPVALLCDLAQQADVIAVRTPDQAAIQ